MIDILAARNCIYQTAYHVVWCSQCRQGVLTGAVADAFGTLLDEICLERSWPIISKKVQPDHIHLLLSIPPATAVADAVKVLKGITARRLFLKFPELKKHLSNGHFWSPTYFVGTAGGVNAETIRRFIERSEHVTRRR